MRTLVGWALVGAELAFLVRGRFVKDKLFAWAPYDEIVEYRIRIWVEGCELDRAEIPKLLRIPAEGRENRCAQHLLSLLDSFISRAPRGSKRSAWVEYRIHGGPPQVRWIGEVVS